MPVVRNRLPIWALLALCLQQCACSQQQQKIRVAADGRHFALAASGQRFIPWGFNYLGRFNELVEESWATDWARLDRDFAEMRRLGANVVRVHLQFATYMKSATQVDQAELDRLRRMLDLAKRHGLYLDITGLCSYRLARVPAWYDALGEAERWQTQARFWQAVAGACAGHPAVFCYDLMNEPIIGGPPKPGEPRWLAGELGGFYFVQRISVDPAGRSNIEIAGAWAAQLTAAIRAKDPHTLITVGVIPWAQVWPGAKPIFYAPQVAGHFDFVSIHLYPGKGEVDRAINALAAYDIAKPIVIEETFPLACTLEEFEQFIDRSAPCAAGWISHYFGRTPAEHRAGAEPGGPATAAFLDYWHEKGRSLFGSGAR